MTMKIIGAVLIVSGGYCIGKVATFQKDQRLKSLRLLEELFRNYERQLREYRSSLQEALEGKGELAQAVLNNKPIRGLISEDEKRVEATVSQLKMGSYSESIAVNDTFLQYLSSTIEKLQEDAATVGKALPLVTGAIGLLVAVLLF